MNNHPLPFFGVNLTKRFIGVLLFDAATTFEEFQKIICAFLQQGFLLEIVAEPKRHLAATSVPLTISPSYSAWELAITKVEEN